MVSIWILVTATVSLMGLSIYAVSGYKKGYLQNEVENQISMNKIFFAVSCKIWLDLLGKELFRSVHSRVGMRWKPCSRFH